MECAVNIKVAGFVRVTLLFVASVVALSGIALARVNPSNGQAPRSAAMAGPVISSIPGIVLVGANFTVTGSGFTAGSVANFFIATGHGTINAGPLNQIAGTGTTVNFHFARYGYSGNRLLRGTGGQYRSVLRGLQRGLRPAAGFRLGRHPLDQLDRRQGFGRQQQSVTELNGSGTPLSPATLSSPVNPTAP